MALPHGLAMYAVIEPCLRPRAGQRWGPPISPNQEWTMSSDDRIESLQNVESHIATAADILVRALGRERAREVGHSLLTDYIDRHSHDPHHPRLDWSGPVGRALAGAQ
jgi:hypothetical protein